MNSVNQGRNTRQFIYQAKEISWKWRQARPKRCINSTLEGEGEWSNNSEYQVTIMRCSAIKEWQLSFLESQEYRQVLHITEAFQNPHYSQNACEISDMCQVFVMSISATKAIQFKVYLQMQNAFTLCLRSFHICNHTFWLMWNLEVAKKSLSFPFLHITYYAVLVRFGIGQGKRPLFQICILLGALTAIAIEFLQSRQG